MPISTRTRLTLYFTLLFGVVVIGLASGAFFLVESEAYAKLDSSLRVAVDATAMSALHELDEHAAEAGGDADLQAVLDEGRDEVPSTQLLVRQGSRVVAYQGNAHIRPDLRLIPPSLLKPGGVVQGLRIQARELQVPHFKTTYQIYSSAELAPTLSRLKKIERTLWLAVPLGLATAAFIGYLLANKSLGPLRDLANTIDAVSSADLSARVTLHKSEDDIGRLGQQFNRLLDRLSAAFTVQLQFMADASHELRTPVTVALASAQVTLSAPARTMADCKEALEIVEQQMLRLKRLVDDMLLLSQADASAMKTVIVDMYLDDAVAEASRAAQPLVHARQQTLRLCNLLEARCRGDQELIRRTVLILLENAIKFTPSGGIIELSLERRGPAWVCSVTDNGVGVPASAQAHIFERFFRAEGAPESKAPGSGLGLAIAKAILEQHDGVLTLVASRPGFTRFELSLPALDEDEVETSAPQANSFAVKI